MCGRELDIFGGKEKSGEMGMGMAWYITMAVLRVQFVFISQPREHSTFCLREVVYVGPFLV